MAIAAQSNILRQDSPIVGAFERELEYIESKVLEKKYPEMKAAEGMLFQIEELAMPWVQTTTFRMVDGVGGFELADDYTTNLPYVDPVGEEFTQRVFSFRSGYYFSEKEVAAAAHRGMPIEQQKISLVRRAYMQKLNQLLLFGDRRTGIAGFVNHWAWLRSYAPYPLDSTSSVSQILATLNSGVTGVINATQDVVEPDTLLLPRTTYNYLTSQSRLDNQLEKTTLQFFLENNPSIRNIDYLRELEGAGPNGENIAIYYKRDPECFKARITDTMRFRQLVVNPFNVYRPVAFDYNGLIVYIPGSVMTLIGV